MGLALHTLSTLFAETYTYTTTTYSSGGGVGAGYLIFMTILVVVSVVAMWKLFVKADEAGWKSIVPIYNTYTLFRIAGRNGWGFLLLFIPLVNIAVLVMISIDLAKHFGKDAFFGVVGLFFFSLIGYLMLAFGDAKYVGPKHA